MRELNSTDRPERLGHRPRPRSARSPKQNGRARRRPTRLRTRPMLEPAGATTPGGKARSAPQGARCSRRPSEPRGAPGIACTPELDPEAEKQNGESPEVALSAVFWASWEKSRRRPTLPHGYPCSTIGSEELNFRVRDGIGCGLFEITTGNCGIRRDRAMRRCERGGPESVPSLLALVQIRLASRILHVTNTAFRLEDTFDATIHSHSRERELERLATLEGILDVCLRDMAKPHDLLVPVSSVPCSTSTPGLSTS